MENSMGLFFDGIRTEIISTDQFSKQAAELNIVRYDLLDPLTGGNKWFKLFPYLQEYQKQNSLGNVNSILSFGGAYSNHIAALAATGQRYGIKTIGIIRGEEVSNITLDRARMQGMELHFVSRQLFKEFREANYTHPFFDSFKHSMIIPEGGSGKLGVQGASAMSEFIPPDINHVIVAAGTGTTAKGLTLSLKRHQQLHVIPVARNVVEIRKLLTDTAAIIHDGYEFGGYAKTTPQLVEFCSRFSSLHGIPVEPIYTGKALFATFQLLTEGKFGRDPRLSFLHTGGLQYQNS